MSKKKKKHKKKQSVDVTIRANDIFNLMGGGNTLQEVADDLGEKYSDLVAEIADNPRIKQAVIDGKEQGKSYWIKKLKLDMYDKECHPSLIKFWFANYMNWYDKPLPEEFNENAEVHITVLQHVPGKKQQALIDKFINA